MSKAKVNKSKGIGITYGEYLLGEGKRAEYKEYKRSDRYEEGENFRQEKSAWIMLERVTRKRAEPVSYQEHKERVKIKNKKLLEQGRAKVALKAWTDSKTGAWMKWFGEMENEGRELYLCTFIFPKFQGGMKHNVGTMGWCEEQIKEFYSRLLVALVWGKDIQLMKRTKELGKCPLLVVAPEMNGKFKVSKNRDKIQLHYHGILALHPDCRYMKHEAKDGIGIVELLENKGGMKTLKFADVQVKQITKTSMRAVHYALKRGIDNVLAFPVFEGKGAVIDDTANGYDRVVKGEFENRRLGGVFKDGIASKRKAELIPAEPLIKGIEFSEGYKDISKQANKKITKKAAKPPAIKRLDVRSSAISRKMVRAGHAHG